MYLEDVHVADTAWHNYLFRVGGAHLEPLVDVTNAKPVLCRPAAQELIS